MKGECLDDVFAISEELMDDIRFVSERIERIKVKANSGNGEMDIKQMADLHRYVETRLFLFQTVTCLDKW